MNLEGVMIKSDRERQILYVITYMRNLKNKMNGYNKNRLIDVENKLVVTSGERGSEGQDSGRGLRDINYYV